MKAASRVELEILVKHLNERLQIDRKLLREKEGLISQQQRTLDMNKLTMTEQSDALRNLKIELDNASARIQETESQGTSYASRLQQLIANHQKMEKECRSLKSQKAQLEQRLKVTEKSLASQDSQLKDSLQTLARLRHKFEKAFEEANTAKNAIATLKESNCDATRRLESELSRKASNQKQWEKKS